jgi:hypothetical protein
VNAFFALFVFSLAGLPSIVLGYVARCCWMSLKWGWELFPPETEES